MTWVVASLILTALTVRPVMTLLATFLTHIQLRPQGVGDTSGTMANSPAPSEPSVRVVTPEVAADMCWSHLQKLMESGTKYSVTWPQPDSLTGCLLQLEKVIERLQNLHATLMKEQHFLADYVASMISWGGVMSRSKEPEAITAASRLLANCEIWVAHRNNLAHC